jgi:hypothetical protein
LVFADNVNLWSEKVNTERENRELLDESKEEIYAVKIRYKIQVSLPELEITRDIKTRNKSLKGVAKLTYFEITVTNKRCHLQR